MSDLVKALKDNKFLGFPELIGIIEDLFQPIEESELFNAEITGQNTNKYTSGEYVISYEVKPRGKSFDGSISISNTAKRNKVLFSANIKPMWDSSPFYGVKMNRRDGMYGTLLDAIKSYKQTEQS